MNLSEIESALSAARKTQTIGLPVSLRVFAEFADGSAQLPEWAALLAAMARRTFDAAPQRVMARLDRGTLQLSLLIEFAGGRTAALTLVRGVASCDALDLILFGNHGVARLEGAECFDAGDSASVEQACEEILAAIEASVSRGEVVEMVENAT